MASDKPYGIGDLITFLDADGTTKRIGEIVGTAPLVVLDGSQTAYRVRPTDVEAGAEVGIAHTDVIGSAGETAPAPADESAVVVETTDAEATPAEAAETEAGATDGTATDGQAAV